MDYKKFIKFLMYFDKRKTLARLNDDQINELLEDKYFNERVDEFMNLIDSYDYYDDHCQIELEIDEMSDSLSCMFYFK